MILSRPTSSLNAHSSGEFSKRHREDSSGEKEAKIPKYGWRLVVLEPELESNVMEDTDDTESNYSIQDKETDFAKDTSDTSTHDDSSVGSSLWKAGELEVDSFSEDDVVEAGSTSSGSENFMDQIAEMICFEDRGLLADSSNSSDIADVLSSCGDPEISRADFWTCIQCNCKTSPLFRYCEKCYRVRKSFFVPRPRGKKKNPRLEPKSSLKATTGSRLKHIYDISTAGRLQHLKNILKNGREASSSEITSDELDSEELRTKAGPSVTKSKPHMVQDWLSKVPLSTQPSLIQESSQDLPPSSSHETLIKVPPSSSQEYQIPWNIMSGSSRDTLLNVWPSSSQENQIPSSQETVKDLHLSSSQETVETPSPSSSKKTLINLPPSSSQETLPSSSSQETIIFLPSNLHKRTFINIPPSSSQESLLDVPQNSSQETVIVLPTNSRQSTTESHPKDAGLSDSTLPTVGNATESGSNLLTPVGQFDGLSSTLSDNTDQDLCIMCLSRPKDALFAHKTNGHQACCYKCAKKVWRDKKRCPICNGLITTVFKIYRV